MEPFHLCIAIGPLALYFLIQGAIHFSRRPVILSGTVETALLGLAMSGLVFVGPMRLFLPSESLVQLNVVAWALLAMFYALCVVLWVLVSRPRLVIYNVTIDELRGMLAELASALDPDPRWAGDHVVLGQLGVEFHLEPMTSLGTVSLVAGHSRQSPSGWRRLAAALNDRISGAERERSRVGVAFVFAAAMLVGLGVLQAIQNPQALAQGFREMLGR